MGVGTETVCVWGGRREERGAVHKQIRGEGVHMSVLAHYSLTHFIYFIVLDYLFIHSIIAIFHAVANS